METIPTIEERIESLRATILPLQAENEAAQQECEKRMLRMKTNTEELTQAWFDRAVQIFVEKHLKTIALCVEFNNLKRAEDFVRFTIYTLEKNGVEERETCPVLYDAEQEVLKIFRGIKALHFPD